MQCPVCNGNMWDNRENKKNPKGPDFTCKDKTCKMQKEKNGEWVPSLYTTGVWVPKTKEAYTPIPKGTPMMKNPVGDGYVPKPKLGDVVVHTQESESDMWKRKGEQMNRSNLGAAFIRAQGGNASWQLLEQIEAWVLTGKTPDQLDKEEVDAIEVPF